MRVRRSGLGVSVWLDADSAAMLADFIEAHTEADDRARVDARRLRKAAVEADPRLGANSGSRSGGPDAS